MRRVPVIDSEATMLAFLIERCRPSMLIIDVEPALAAWNSSQAALDEAVTRLGSQTTVSHVLILTNSRRRATTLPAGWEQRHRARKPWTRRLGARGKRAVVVGDQSLNDGLLAWRIGAVFIRVRPPAAQPWYPALVERIMGPLARAYLRPSSVTYQQ